MKYFFDTNVISKIVLFLINKKEPSENDIEILREIKNILKDKDSQIYINRLVELEALRAIPKTHKKLFKETKNILNEFEKLVISKDIYYQAIEFSRFCKSKGVSLGKCEIIDYLHFLTAKNYNLILVSDDKDMKLLEAKYQEFKAL